jgi:hypothetical protein
VKLINKGIFPSQILIILYRNPLSTRNHRAQPKHSIYRRVQELTNFTHSYPKNNAE